MLIFIWQNGPIPPLILRNKTRFTTQEQLYLLLSSLWNRSGIPLYWLLWVSKGVSDVVLINQKSVRCIIINAQTQIYGTHSSWTPRTHHAACDSKGQIWSWFSQGNSAKLKLFTNELTNCQWLVGGSSGRWVLDGFWSVVTVFQGEVR